MDPEEQTRVATIMLCVAVLAFAYSIKIERGQKDLPFDLLPYPYRAITGKPCPLCGSTRSFIHAAHGHFKDAIELNPLGLIAFILTIVVAVYHTLMLIKKKYRERKKYGRV